MIGRNPSNRHRPVAASAVTAPPMRMSRSRPPFLMTVMMWVLMIFTIVPEGFKYAAPPAPVIPGMQVSPVAAMPTEGSPLSRTIWLILLAFGVITLASKSKAAMKVVRATNPYLLLFMGLVALSILWSIEPAITTRRLIRAGTVVIDALAFATVAQDLKSFQRTMRPILLAVCMGSIIFVMQAPELAIEQLNQAELIGAWHGLAAQKNGLGSLAAVGVLLWLHALLSKETNPLLAVFGMIVCGVCLVNSRSSTSIMAAIFSCLLILMLMRSPQGLRRYLPYLIGLFVILLLTYSLAVLNLLPGSGMLLAPITALTGKDQTFSGRTAIWEIINRHIALSPLLGSGYGAYWVQVPESPSMETLRRLYFYPTESHNGYLDVINDLGYVGGFLLIGYLISYVRQGLRIFKAIRYQGALFLALIFEQMIANLSEARWFNSLSNEFVFTTIATAAMANVLLYLARQPVQPQPPHAQPAAATPRLRRHSRFL